MIARFWRGWTTRADADAYQHIVLNQVIPGIEARRIAGFQHIDVLRQDPAADGPDEVEFVTIMWFTGVDAIKAFMGEDYTASHVPEAARAVLKRFDLQSQHFEILDRRPQSA